MLIKANYNLGQGQLGVHRPQEAFETALAAYKLAIDQGDGNAEVLSKLVLRAKQTIWEGKETARLREQNETLKKLEELLEKNLAEDLKEIEMKYSWGEIGEVARVEDKDELRTQHRKEIGIVRSQFAKDNPEMKERVSDTV